MDAPYIGYQSWYTRFPYMMKPDIITRLNLAGT
jgi:hypothetical protein